MQSAPRYDLRVLIIDKVLDGRDVPIGHALRLPFLKVCHRYAVSTRIFIRGGGGNCFNSPGVMLRKQRTEVFILPISLGIPTSRFPADMRSKQFIGNLSALSL